MKPPAFLENLQVLVLGHYVPAPLAGWLLQQLGAKITKIEPPSGDFLRHYPPFLQDANGGTLGAYYHELNRDFTVQKLDLKSAPGLEDLKSLMQSHQVLIDGNRAGSLEKWLGQTVHSVNPELTYIPITAHGLSGPLRDAAGHDNNLLARSGVLSYTATDAQNLPAAFSAPVADILSAFTAALAATAAHAGSPGNGGGFTVDASMLHSAFFFNQLALAGMNATQTSPVANQEWMNGGMPNYSVYRTKDEKAVFFGPIEPHLFAAFCEKVERTDLVDLPFANPKECKGELRKIFAGRTLQEWEVLLQDVDCCFSPVNDLKTALTDPQIVALGLVETVEDEHFGEIRSAKFPATFHRPTQ